MKACFGHLLLSTQNGTSPALFTNARQPRPAGFSHAIGVIRQIQRPTYETLVHQQMQEPQAKRGTGNWKELLHGSSTWTVE